MNVSGRIVSLLAAALVVGIVSGAETPLCALRFGYRFSQPDKWPGMRAALEKNRGAFDEIWFSTGVTFPKLAWHEEHARQCAASRMASAAPSGARLGKRTWSCRWSAGTAGRA